MIPQTIIRRLSLIGLLLIVSLFTAQGLLYAQASSSLPDLVVQDLTLDPKSPAAGDNVRLTATIANIGRSNVDELFTVVIQVDQVVVGQQTISGLRARQKTTVQAGWKAIVGTHTIRVEVDPFGEISESDKSNNALQRLVIVTPLQGVRSLTGDLLAAVAQGLQGAGQPLQLTPDPDLLKLLGNLTKAFDTASEAFSAAALSLMGASDGLPTVLTHDPQLLAGVKISDLYNGLAKSLKTAEDALNRANLQQGQAVLKQAADQLAQLSQMSLAGIGLASVQSASTAMLQVAGQAEQLQAALDSNQSAMLNQVVSELLGMLSAAGQQLVTVGKSTAQSASQRAVRFQSIKGEPLQRYYSSDPIQIVVPSAQDLRWELFDLSGAAMVQTEAKKIDRLLWGGRADSGKPLAPGQYFYRVTAVDGTGSRVELGRLIVESP
jgi:hypothetical protein